MDVPNEDTFQNKDDKDDNQDGEKVWLIVEDGNSLGSGTDSAKPVELTHFEGRQSLCGVERNIVQET